MGIEEAYVTFETAKLLKEKGFGECSTSYISEDGDIFPTPLVKRKEHYPAPTQQMAMRWLREEKEIEIHIALSALNADKSREYQYDIFFTNERYMEPSFVKHGFPYYEDAVEEALKFCLTKLI